MSRRVNEVVETVTIGVTSDIKYSRGKIYSNEDFPDGKIPAWLFRGYQTDEERTERDALLADPTKGVEQK